MLKLVIYLSIIVLLISCDNYVQKSEYDLLNSDLIECRKIVEELQNTPQVRLSNGQKYFLAADFANAKNELKLLIEKFSDSNEAKKAKSLLVEIEKREQEIKEVAERKKTLGFKILKEIKLITVGEIKMNFGNIETGQKWIFDRYGDEWRYRSAERGEKFVLAKLSISSDNKNPVLPPIGIYIMKGGELVLNGTMGYEFSRWDDYASYLGNNHDFKNDFAHSKSIPFSLGLSVSNDNLNDYPVFIIVKKENCFYRDTNRFNNPPVAYSPSGCYLKPNLTLDDFENEYVVVKIFNKNKF